MGLSTEPTTTTVDPTPAAIQPLQGQAADFLQGLFQQPGQSPFAALTSPLQTQAGGAISSLLGQPAPEVTALNAVSPGLTQLASGGLQNPFLPQGPEGFQQGQQLVAAAQPVFQQNLNEALTTLTQRAPSLRNTAFGGQAGGLAQQALQDFNLFQQQALQQGQALDLQAQGQALNFMLGGAGQQIGAAQALGGLAGQAGQAPFQRALGAGQFGAGLTQQAINPTLQLLLGGLQFGQPMAQETIVGPSPLSQTFGAVGDIASLGLGIGALPVAGGGSLLGNFLG